MNESTGDRRLYTLAITRKQKANAIRALHMDAVPKVGSGLPRHGAGAGRTREDEILPVAVVN